MQQPCKKCSNQIEPITLDDIKEGSTDLFMFEQGGTCYCFYVYTLYRTVFGTLDIQDNMYLENARNPLTGQTLDQKTLRRLYEQYKNWRERYKSDLMNVDGVVLTQEDVEEYKDGMEKMEIQMRKAGVSPTAEQVAHAYTSDLLELDEDDEKSKALYKLITEKDFSQDK